MRHILLGMLFSLVAALPAFAAASGAELNLKGDQVFVVNGDKSTALDREMFPAQPIGKTDMRFFPISPEDAKKQGVEPGLYIFKGQGKPFAFTATENAEFCWDASLSPSGSILAMDAGTSLVRNWFFYSFPDMKPMGETLYYQTQNNPPIIWVKDAGVLVSTMAEDDHGRTCEYDPCGSVSVSYYDFKTAKSTKLLSGTELCDYTLVGVESDGITGTAAELCLPKVEDWKNFPEDHAVKTTRFTIPAN